MHQRFVTTALAATWYYLYVSCLSITCAFSSSRPSSSADVLNVPEIMALIQRTYPLGSGTTSKQQWAKTRNYLYHYRANSKQPRNTTTSVVRTTKRVRTKHLSLETVQQIIHFLETNFPKDRQLQAHILQTSPRILSQYHSIESRLLPTMELLRRLYGNLPDRHGVQGMMIYEAIWRNTNLLLVRGVGYGGGGWEGETNNSSGGRATTTMEEDSTTMNEYLMNDLGVSSAGISKLKQSHPALFQVSLNQTVKPVVQFLRSIFQHRSKPMYHPMARIITNHPMLFHLDVDTNLAPKARFLQSFCGMNDKELADVIATTPGILGVSLEHNLRVTLQFLLDALTIDSETNPTVSNSNRRKNESIARLKKCLVKHPQILGLSLENLSAKLSYFDQLDQRSNHKKGTLSSRILLVAPSTYSLSLTNLAEKIQYLAAIWDCEAASLSDHLRVYPQILTLSMEGNIKVGFLQYQPFAIPTNRSLTDTCALHCTAYNGILQHVGLYRPDSRRSTSR